MENYRESVTFSTVAIESILYYCTLTALRFYKKQDKRHARLNDIELYVILMFYVYVDT